jgi:DUF1016 N-terminal domain
VSAMAKRKENAIYGRIREILESARAGVARTVNTTQVMANWLIGREIVEEEQRGKARAGYGKELLRQLSGRLHKEFGAGFSVDNLQWFRQLYLSYPNLLSIYDAPRRKLPPTPTGEKYDALRHISPASISDALRRISDGEQKSHSARGKSATAKGHALAFWDRRSKKLGHRTKSPKWFRTQCVRNPGSPARFIRICRGRTTVRCCEWIAATLVLSTKSRRLRTIGQPESWSGKSTAWFTSGWPKARTRLG